MKKLVLATAIAASFAGLTSVAQAEVSANIGVTSNYVWRGQTQSSDGPSISGGVDYAHESGFYAGTWMGTVDFTGDDPSSEVDYYFGFGGESGEFSYDVGYAYFGYPQDGGDYDFGEVYASGSTAGFTLGFALTVNDSSDSAGVFVEDDLYYYGSYEGALPQDWGYAVTVGSYHFEDSDADYVHYGVDFSKGDFTYSISSTDIDGTAGDPRFFVSWGIGF